MIRRRGNVQLLGFCLTITSNKPNINPVEVLVKTRSLKSRIMFLIIVVLPLMIVVLSYFRMIGTQNQAMENAGKRLASNVFTINLVFDQMMEYSWILLNTVHDLSQVQEAVRGGSSEAADTALAGLFNFNLDIGGFNLYAGLLVFDADFHILAYAATASLPEDFNARNTPHTENVRQAELGNAWASDVTLSPVTGLAQIWITRPIMDGNIFLGMVAIPIHTEGLAHFLASHVYQTGKYYTVIADGSGTVAYSNRRGYLGQNIVALGMAPSFAQLKQGEMFEYRSIVSGNRDFAYLSIHLGMDWMIISAIDRSSVLATPVEIIMQILPTILAVLFGIGLLMYIIRALKPLELLTGTLNDIANGGGDLTVRIPETGPSEVADASKYFNQTIGKIRDVVVMIKKQAGTLSDIGNELAGNMTETASAINQITANIQSIKGRVINQSAGVTETNSTMEQVTVNIGKLNDHVERQADAVSQSSAAIEQMLANIRSVTETLTKNEENVKELQESSDTGRSSLQEVAADIQDISKESEGLLEINSVMKNIASQTNLLSMNAAIEAAHAGEAGRGFAVVADEIRKLAESSGQQSKTIGTVLKKIKESIDSITWATNNVLNKFEDIDRGVRTVVEQEGAIRSIMEEQSHGNRQILQVSGQVNEITQQVKGGSQEMLEGSKEVIQESKNLEKTTQEITNGMNEMAVGTDQINKAVNSVNELSNRNQENISVLVQAISQFKV